MKSMTRAVMTVLLLSSSAHAVNAQSVEDVIERHLTASGGRAALETLTSRAITGTITVTTPAGDITGSIEIVNVRPGKERTLVVLDLTALGAGTMTVDRRFDGTAGYVIDSLQGNRDVTGPELDNLRNQAGAFPNPFLTYRAAGMSVTMAGREKVGERDTYVLLATPKSGAPVRVFIDAESYLSLKSVSMSESPQVGQFEATTEMLDYRDVDGFKVPFRIKLTSAGQSFTIAVTKVEHNVAVDGSLFAMPSPGSKE
jgi:hypothetical protein